MWLCVFSMLLFTRSGGPNSLYLFDSVFNQVILVFSSVSSKATQFPYGSGAIPATTSSLSNWHAVGAGIYLLLITVAIVHVWSTDSSDTQIGRILGVKAAVMYAAAYIPPFVGINFLIFSRWGGFIYFSGGILAALGLSYILRSIPQNTVLHVMIVFLVVSAGVGLMGTSYLATPDGSPFDGGLSQDFSISEKDQDIIEFTDNYHSQAVYSDHLTSVVLDRWYGANGDTVTIKYPENTTLGVDSGDLLLIRPYTISSKAHYRLDYISETIRVAGPVPVNNINCDKNKIYSSSSQYKVQKC